MAAARCPSGTRPISPPKKKSRPLSIGLPWQAKAVEVDAAERLVLCRAVDGHQFYVSFDFLAICTGSQGSTFGIPGVEHYAHFLREINHAEDIRRRLIDNVGAAALPGRAEEERMRLLHTVIVGGGPTGRTPFLFVHPFSFSRDSPTLVHA